MLSKNNKKLQIEKMEPQCQRFTIKKLTFGVASVLIGTTLSLYAGDTIASANDSNDETTEIIADRTSENAVLSNAETTMDEGNSETIPTSNNNVINSNSSAIVDDPVLSRIVTANNKAAELVADGDASESSSKNSSASETNEAATNEEDKQAGAATETATTTDNTKLSDTEASTNDSTVTEPKTADPQADQAQPAANTSFRAATTEDATETTATTTNLLPQTNEVTIKEEPMAKPDLKYYTGFIVGDDAAKNAILNTADFPENATYTWVTKPDVTKAGSTSGQVKVTFPDEFDPDYVHELLVTVPATVEDINMRNSTIEFNKPIFHVNEDIDSINDLLTRDYVQNTFIKKLTLANGTVFEGQALKDLLDAVVAEFSWGVDPDVDVAGDDIGARLRAKLNNRSSVTWPVKVDVIGAEAKTGLQTPWGTEIDAADTIANVDELKQFDKTDTPVSYAWKTKPNFKPGVGVDHNVTGVVVVNYPDGTTQDVTVSVLVDKSDADKFIESQGVKTQTVTVKRGEVIDPKQAFDGITDATKADLNVTGATFNTSVDTSATAQKDYPAMVTFADGSMTVVDIPVVVTEQAQDYAPVAKAIETGLNNLPTAESAIDVAASNLPTGTTYAWKQAPDVTTKGVKDAVVVVTYPDGSTDDVAVKVTVVAQNDEFIPSYKDKATVAGDTVTLEPTINDKNGKDATLPTGTRFEFEGTAPEKVTLDATTGVVTVTDPTVDTKVPAIVVTYPDGTKTTLTPTLTVYPLPESSAIEVAVKAELTPENAKQAVKNSATLPADAEYTWAKTPDTSEPGYLTGTVSVKYPNGTIKDVVVNVKVGTDAQINDPKTQEVKTPVGESPDASAGIENLGELPAGTKVKWKDPVDTTTPGHKEGTVVVTYPDGSSEEMTVPVKVGTDEQINDPESQEVKVALNGTPDAQEGIKNFDKLPEGTTVEWKEPVDTTTSGHKEGTVVVTYPDGTSEEVTVPVKVGTDEQINTPEGQEIKVALNGIPDANAGIKNLDKLPEGTKVEWKEPVDTMTPGHKEGTVVVTYPDGSSEEVTVPVKVGTDEQINDPESQEVKVALNGTPDAQEGIKNFDKLSEGTTVEWKEPVDTTTPGHKEGTVVVTYPDGTSEEVTVPVKVGTDEQINIPEGQEIKVALNGTPDANAGIKNLDKLPEGTKVEWKEPVDTMTPGHKEGTVVVTYPDGSSEEVTVPVKVGTDEQINDPESQEVKVALNGTPDAQEGIKNFDKLPEGTTVEWKEPVDTTTSGHKEGTVVVTYPDGTSEEVTVPVKVGTDEQINTPEGQEIKVALNGIPDANAGIKNLDKLPEGTKVEWKEPVDTMTPGHKEGTVVVTYPDGSSEEVTVPVKVGTDEQINDPESQEVKVALNGTPDAQEGIKNFDKLSEGTTVEWKEPVDTTTPGHKEGTVVVTYPDGTSEEVTVPVKVGTDEQINTPEGQDIEVEVNGTPNANEGIANLGDLPTGTNVAWKTPVDTTTPGTKEGTIVVTYPNGTSEEVTVAVKVGTDAEINDPKGQDLEVEVNGTPNANEGIANLGDLPTGTNVAWKTPVDTTTPGTKEGTIVVTYPDGTGEEVTVAVKVGTDAEINDPKGQDLEVEVNGTPNANEGIANLGDLPTGTNVAWKAPVDTTTPGTKEGTIVVTYPDGTSKEVTVSIKVGTDNKVLTVNKLPQTGNVDNHKLVALGWLSLLAGLLQFGVGKRKKRDEK